NNYKIISIQNSFKDYDFSLEECKKLNARYGDINVINSELKEHPYVVFVEVLHRDFEYIDNFICKKFPNMRHSTERCEFAILDVLDSVEVDGSTRINANECMRYIPRELLDIAVETVNNSDRIYYDKDTKYMSKMSTWTKESFVAEKLKKLLENSSELGLDVEGYINTLNECKLTKEQLSILDTINKNNVCLLMGSAGCVDGDTEFFNGHEWKKIRDFDADNDLVLQYHTDGSAKLVKPLRYWKVPCQELYHFETKYGVSQTVCSEHDIIFRSPKGVFSHTNIQDIINKQNSLTSGFHGLFMTSFNYDGSGIELTDDEIRVMVAVMADGSFQKNNPTSTRCRFHIKKEHKKERLRELFNNAGCEFVEHQSATEGYTDFHVTVPRREKVFSKYWYGCNHHQLEIVCDEVMRWDGSTNYSPVGKVKRQRFSTTIKESADFVQFAFSATGRRATISINDRRGRKRIVNGKEYITKSVEYSVGVTDKTLVGLCSDNRLDHTKTKVYKVPTNDGYKYCFTVPSHLLVLRNNNCIFITGNCGKSYTTKAIVDLFTKNNISFRLLAPTGIASKVLRNATGRHASTIHSAVLGLIDSPFFEDVIIIDEFSMVSLDVMYMVCQHLKDNHRLIMVCDPSQLPSISCGNILTDIINSGIVPNVTLTKVFRYGTSGIATVATNIRQGVEYVDNGGMTEFDCVEKDYQFYPINSSPLEQIDEIYADLLTRYDRKDIMILSPFNKGSFGTRAINNMIQDKYNPSEHEVGHKYAKFHVNDMVINIHNNYNATTREEFEYNNMALKNLDVDFEQKEFPKVSIMNGDIGVVTDIDNDKNVYVQFDDEEIVYEYKELHNLLLAYAISIHKSQGSQAKVVVVITHPQHKRMLNRNILYVATTRATTELIEIGSAPTINEAIKIEETQLRDTWLRELLKI
ncbi:MAG: AAA family ATPase, partial [Prevotellaceae bacterium]|nr:AAA family ATPase [Candidatus Faecinaster equi]